MAFNTEGFVTSIVSIVVGIIVICLVALPIIQQATSDPSFDPTLKTIIDVIPIFLVISVLLATIGLFAMKKAKAQ